MRITMPKNALIRGTQFLLLVYRLDYTRFSFPRQLPLGCTISSRAVKPKAISPFCT